MYKSLAVSMALVALALPGTVSAQATDKGHHSSGAMKDMHGSGANDMHGSMMKGMKGMQSMQMSGDVDKDFAMMMKMHHEGALTMAQMELDKGKDPKMKEMARKIIDSQKKEIAEFDQWLKARK